MDPITIAAAIAAAGKLFQGFTALMSGNEANKAAKRAAQQAREEAAIRRDIALDDGERVSARAAVNAAASGGGLTGSALDVMEDLGRQAMFNARTAQYEGETEAQRRLYEGQIAKKEGQMALVKSAFDAGSTFLSGAGQAAQARRSAGSAAASQGTMARSTSAQTDLRGLY